uniref:Pentacotripeptide-repeat region of PRORP domain-containing protein n=1 Tax=Fagus sylvatica TaxID=28930 RepID=A0A2N9IER0_FAGSY
MYALCGFVPHVRRLFDEILDQSSFFYNTVMRMYIQNSVPYEALCVFVEMLSSKQCWPDNFTYLIVIKCCSDLSLLSIGVVVHGKTLKAGLDLDTFVQNSLLSMYMNCGEKEAARRVFYTMWEQSIMSWNTMINGYLRNGCAKEAMMVFSWIMEEGMELDCATMVSVLPAYGYLKDLVSGRRVYALVEDKGLGKKIVARNALVDMYAKCGSMDEAWLVVDKMGERDVITWTTMISGYILNGDARSALALCQLMHFEGVRPNSHFACLLKCSLRGKCWPDNFTYPIVIKACGDLSLLSIGVVVHGKTLKAGLDLDSFVQNSLFSMYMNCGEKEAARRVFDTMWERSVVSWNTMINGYLRNGCAKEAMMVFSWMMEEGMEPDCATMVSVLPACGYLKDLVSGRRVHALVEDKGLGKR